MRCPRCNVVLVVDDYMFGMTIDNKALCFTCSNKAHAKYLDNKKKAEARRARNKRKEKLMKEEEARID